MAAEGDWETAEDWVAFTEENLGPVIAAKAQLEPDGKWGESRGKMVELFAQFEKDGDFKPESEYLRTVGRVS